MTLVVKLGSSLVVDRGGRVRRGLLAAHAGDVAALVRGGEQVCVVSSGAIALGLARLGLARRPRSTARLQAASAIGQAGLQAAWDRAFRDAGLRSAQVLLTARDLADRSAYVNVRNALETLLRLGVVPVVNENDATATDEITFGDNDALAAQVAVLTRSRLLVLLTEVDGVYSEHPASPHARPLDDGAATAEALLGPPGALGRGGMASKVAAARMAAAAGIPCVIASGRRAAVLPPLAAGERRGTHFAAGATPASAFRLWLLHAKPASGRVVVDEGAERALVEGGRSLLAVGVARCAGKFVAGDAVELVSEDGRTFAKGLASADAADLRARPRGVEAVHRDRLVLLTSDAGKRPGTYPRRERDAD